MIAASAMSEISLPNALGLTVLGMAIVFIVLVFLMIIIFIMTAIIRRFSVKPAVTAGSAVTADALPAPDGLAQDTTILETTAAPVVSDAAASELPTTEPTAPEPAPAIAESTATAQGDPSAAAAATSSSSAPKKYRVIVNGVEFEVDAEYGQNATVSAAPQPETLAAPDAAASGTSVPMPVGAPFPTASDTKKYKVVVNDIEYEVDAETDATPEPVLTTSGTRKYKVIVNDIEYEVDAETGEAAAYSGIEKG